MVAHFIMRTYGVNKAFRFIEEIWLHRKSPNHEKKSEKTYLALYVCNMFWATIL